MKRPLDYLAFIISAILSPYITALVFIVIITYKYSQNLGQFLPWMSIAFVFAVIIPGFYILWLLESKAINDIHISNLKDRKRPFLITGISSLIGAIILDLVHAARPVVVMAYAYAANAVVISAITQFWKVSVHTALFSAVSTIALILFGLKFWWLYLLLIPLAWSRIHRKRHSILQVVGGTLLAFVLTCAVFWGFGYL
jgi:membrane-associated phospholipid phosphatase